MAKRCETFDHTADMGLAASADTLGELFEALGEGLADLICPRSQAAARQTRQLRVVSDDLEALAVDFLTKILVAIQTDHFIIAAVTVSRIDDTSLEAEIAGEAFDPGKHEFHTEVKAATYHQLRVTQDGEKWTARAILDIYPRSMQRTQS